MKRISKLELEERIKPLRLTKTVDPCEGCQCRVDGCWVDCSRKQSFYVNRRREELFIFKP